MEGIGTRRRLARQGVQGVGGPVLSEVFPARTGDCAALGFVLAQIPQAKAPILWVQDRLSGKECGRPSLAGFGADRPLITVDLTRAADVLLAMEDGLRCKALGAVIGEVWGDPSVLDFTATKRLALRAEAAGIPCWLIRQAAPPNLSAARERWRIASAPSAPHPHDPRAPGMPRWSLDLFRSRYRPPGQWMALYDGSANRLDLVAPHGDGAVATRDGAVRDRAAG